MHEDWISEPQHPCNCQVGITTHLKFQNEAKGDSQGQVVSKTSYIFKLWEDSDGGRLLPSVSGLHMPQAYTHKDIHAHTHANTQTHTSTHTQICIQKQNGGVSPFHSHRETLGSVISGPLFLSRRTEFLDDREDGHAS